MLYFYVSQLITGFFETDEQVNATDEKSESVRSLRL